MSIRYNTILQDCFNKYEISKAQENCDLDFDCDIQCLSDMFHENKTRKYEFSIITYMYALRFINRYASIKSQIKMHKSCGIKIYNYSAKATLSFSL